MNKFLNIAGWAGESGQTVDFQGLRGRLPGLAGVAKASVATGAGAGKEEEEGGETAEKPVLSCCFYTRIL